MLPTKPSTTPPKKKSRGRPRKDGTPAQARTKPQPKKAKAPKNDRITGRKRKLDVEITPPPPKKAKASKDSTITTDTKDVKKVKKSKKSTKKSKSSKTSKTSKTSKPSKTSQKSSKQDTLINDSVNSQPVPPVIALVGTETGKNTAIKFINQHINKNDTNNQPLIPSSYDIIEPVICSDYEGIFKENIQNIERSGRRVLDGDINYLYAYLQEKNPDKKECIQLYWETQLPLLLEWKKLLKETCEWNASGLSQIKPDDNIEWDGILRETYRMNVKSYWKLTYQKLFPFKNNVFEAKLQLPSGLDVGETERINFGNEDIPLESGSSDDNNNNNNESNNFAGTKDNTNDVQDDDSNVNDEDVDEYEDEDEDDDVDEYEDEDEDDNDIQMDDEDYNEIDDETQILDNTPDEQHLHQIKADGSYNWAQFKTESNGLKDVCIITKCDKIHLCLFVCFF